MDGVERAWAIISASQSNLHFSGSMDDPIVGLPTFDLSYNPVTKRYEGTYQGFTYTGPYTILFLAQDTKGMVSYPKTVHLNVKGYNQDRAFLVYDPGLEDYADFAQWVLTERRYTTRILDQDGDGIQDYIEGLADRDLNGKQDWSDNQTGVFMPAAGNKEIWISMEGDANMPLAFKEIRSIEPDPNILGFPLPASVSAEKSIFSVSKEKLGKNYFDNEKLLQGL